MTKLRVLDLFSGIGGFSLGLERTGGFETVAFCEIEKYPQKVLAKHWPGVPIYDDVRELTAERLAADGIGVDVITGGFPCQDISLAGKQAGIAGGTRSGLWSEIARLVGELRPGYVIVENVTALLSGDSGRWFGRVLGDLAALGYDAEWHCIPASELGAHHHRDRVWIIAYAKELQRDGSNNDAILIMGDEQVPKSGGCYWSPDMAYAVQFRSGKNIFKCEQPNSAGPSSRSIDSRTHTSDVASTISERQQGQGEYVKPLLAEAIGYWKAVNAESGCISGIWAAEPGMGGAFDGFPDWLDRHCGKGMNYEESQRSIKTLRSLWDANVSQALWENIGGLGRVQQAEALFSIVREFQAVREKRDFAMAGEEACQEILRIVRGTKESPCTPLRPESSEQQPREFTDALQMVSQLPPCDSQASWQINSWEDGIPRVANGIPDRAHRLKALGNAVVPQIPELIGRAILEASR